MVGKVLIGLLVVAGLFLVYSLLSPGTANASTMTTRPQNKWINGAAEASAKAVVATGNVQAIDKFFNTGAGHF